MVRFKIFMLVAWLMFAGLVSRVRADILIDGYTDATNDRFTNSPSFIMNGFDLSGIGHGIGGVWATAISRNVVISSAHSPSSGVVFFYPSNDPAEVPVERSVVSGTKVGSTDLYLAVLDAPLPNQITHYSFATEPLVGTPPGMSPPLSVDSAGIYDGLVTYMFGVSPFDQNSDPQRNGSNDQAVGRNRITGYSEDVPFLGNVDNDSIILRRDSPGDANYVPFEAKFASGDSSGPTFVDIGGELRLLGTNAFIYGDNDFLVSGDGSGINYTGNQAAFIQNYVALHAVPEPSSLSLIAISVWCLAIRRRSL